MGIAVVYLGVFLGIFSGIALAGCILILWLRVRRELQEKTERTTRP